MSLEEELNIISIEELRSYTVNRLETMMKIYKIPIGESKGNKTHLISRILTVAEVLNIKFRSTDQNKELDLGNIDIFGSE